MADDESNYVTVGRIFRDDLYKENDPWAVQDADLRPLMKCIRCGALVNGGGLSREKHDAFHVALAQLFEDLAAIEEIAKQARRLTSSTEQVN